MSSLNEDFTLQQMEEDGELQFIRDHIAAAKGEALTPAPADTVPEEENDVEIATGEPPVTETEPQVGDEQDPEEAPGDDGGEGLTPEEEEVIYLELDPDTQALVDSKYGGDVGKALTALRESQSLIGRQGSELGELRRELQEFQQSMQQQLVQAQPYPEWPEEYEDGPEAAQKFRAISEAAFQRGDVQTFQQALGGWEQADPVSAGLYRDLKEMQIAQSMNQQQAPVVDDEATLVSGVEAIRAKYPQFQDESFQAAVAAELDKTPSLKAVLWEGVPGVTPQERLNVLEEAAQRVASRLTDDTVQQARKRVAIRNSEEARAARVAAQSVRGGSAREEAPEVEARVVPMGESGRGLDINRLNSMLDPDDRV